MLIYHPAFDASHTAFRMLLISELLEGKTIEIDRICIVDLLYSFPNVVSDIRLTPELRRKRGTLPKKKIYSLQKEPKAIFYKMQPIQIAAINFLVAKGFYEVSQYEKRILKRSSKEIPQRISQLIRGIEGDNREIINFLINDLGVFPLIGKNGLKDRTRIMEYRYDVETV